MPRPVIRVQSSRFKVQGSKFHHPVACLALLLVSAIHSPAADRHSLRGHVVPPVAAGLRPTGRLPGSETLHLAVGLPLRNKESLTNLLQRIYDPSSSDYHNYLTSEQFTEQFGPTEAAYQTMIGFMQTNGFKVTGTHPNRLVLDVSGSVADIERTFRLTLRIYPHPTEPRDFHAPDAEPSVPDGLDVVDISGLEDYMPPRPVNLITGKNRGLGPQVQSYATGGGPGGDFLGYDFRDAYAPGVQLTGVGQVIGLFEFGPYFTNDIILYKQRTGLTTTVTNVLLDGFTGIPASGADDGEETLDIDMAMCMAPGATIIVYEGNSAIDIFNRMATDNKAKQMSCSFGFLPPPSTMDNVFAQYAAQGQTLFVASGDSGAYSTNAIFAPADDPNITSVGGTSLTTTGPQGTWVSETTWGGSGGGISPNYTIPSYQTGMSMSANHGSTTRRNFPDVAMLADVVIYWYYKNGQSSTVGGTSAAAPLWAGFMALINQQCVANGKATIGSFNSTIYNIGNYSNNYSSVFHDITTGNNFNTASPTNFPAVTGYDLATGWGSPNGSNLINMLAAPTDALNITPGTGFTITTPFGVPFGSTNITLSLTNSGLALVNWGLAITSAWLNASMTNGTLLPASAAATVTINLDTTTISNLAAGTYYSNVRITNGTSGVVQARLFTLFVAGANMPLAVTGLNAGVVVPANGTLANPQATAFDVPNNYAFYQSGLSGGSQGLPPSGNFYSQLDGTVYQIGPYGATNALMMGSTYPTTGTLTLASPQSFNSLAILASSANGGGVGTVVLHFTNGTSSQSFSFNGQDWFNNSANVALQGFGRVALTTLMAQNNGTSNPNFYQTTINLAAMGLNQPVASLTFTKPSASGTSGIFALSGAIMPPQPAIAQQPQSTTNSSGGASSFWVIAMGAPPLTYQWFNGNPPGGSLLTNQTGTNLVFNPATTNNAGNYFVIITNTYGAITSSVATLTVLTAPVITQQPNPTNLNLFTGQTNRFFVGALGAVPLAYAWRLNGAPISGATGSGYTNSNLQLTNTGNYTVTVSNSYGMVTSSIVSLTVVPAPTYPYGQLVVADHPLGYWRLDETSGAIAHDYIGGNNGTYTNVQLAQAGDNLIDTHKAARFGVLSSANSYVANLPVDFATNGNAELTVEAWVNGAAQSNDNGLITKGTGAGGEQFNLDCGSGNHAFRFFVRDASGGVHLANGTIALNSTWHHLAGVCDQANGKVILYIDGVSNASGAITAGTGLQSTANAATFGSRQSGGATAYDLQFSGTMEEVAIYNYPLSAARILAHYVSVTNRPPIFLANPFTEPSINAGAAYSATIATNASDPNGDAITFGKVSGPAWLAVAASGALSGAPANSDAGTNTFIISARDPAGSSNTATMRIFVNGAPAFLSDPFTELSVNVGVPYSANIATNATDPDNDSLTFSKISGPTWLGLAADGTLSGTPANSDIGTNSFVVSVTDTGGLSTNATMYIFVNGAPVFLANPFAGPPATAGQAYSGNIATNATDADGDSLTFAKVSGPAWLALAGDGTLSGTPLPSDAGTNSFSVSATDPGGLSATASMNITVAAGGITASVSLQGTNLTLIWLGGTAPYQVQMSTDLGSTNWQTIAGPITTNVLTLSPSNAAAFYRVIGQ